MEKTHIIEKSFIHSNKPCVVIFTQIGHRCGYVAVEKDSPLYGIYYDNLNIKHNYYSDVHGGLIFSDYSELYPITTKRPLYWFGFDCAHYNDAKDLEASKKYFDQKTYNQIIEYNSLFQTGAVKTLDFCITECKSLAEQLTELENLIKESNNAR